MSLLEKTMNKLHDDVEFNNSLYHYKDRTKNVNFIDYNNTKILFNMIKNKEFSLIKA